MDQLACNLRTILIRVIYKFINTGGFEHTDLPVVEHVDLPVVKHVDLPVAKYVDLPVVEHVDFTCC
jgi:hypothetical protein